MASIVIFILFSSIVKAQDDAVGMDESSLISTQQQFDALEYYAIHPIDIRNNADEIMLLPGMTTRLYRLLKRLIKENPDIDSIEELLNHSPETIDTSLQRILLLCTVIRNPQMHMHARHRMRISLSTPEVRGMKEDTFLGSAESFMQRLFIGNQRYTVALSYGKHSGESYQHGLYHGSLQYAQKHVKLIIGDHSLDHGMGSLLASGISIADQSKPTRRALQWSSSIRQTTSLIEASNFRGIGAQYFMDHSAMKYMVGMSYSNRNRHASINDEGMLTGFPSSTYARTEHELSQREGTQEVRIAIYNSVQLDKSTLSVAGLYQSYEHSIAPSASSIGEQEQWICAFDVQSELQNGWTISGNALFDKRYNSGGMLTLHHDGGIHDQAIMIRYFDPDIRSPIGQSFGRSGICSNDIGLHLSMNGMIGSFAYALSNEVYSQLRIPLNAYSIRNGIRMIGQLTYAYEHTKFLCRIINEIRTLEKPLFNQQSETDWRIRSEISHAGRLLRSVARVETHIITQSANPSFGIGCALEFHSATRASPWHWSIRIAWAQTDDFNSAIYLPETGLPGQLLIDPLYGFGTMSAGQIGYTFGTAKISCSIRQKYKPKEESLGSGWLRIDGNQETEFHVQTDITL